MTTAETDKWPKLVAFDLDYTLWDLWIDTHVSAPLRREKKTINELRDRHDEIVSFYPHVPQILHTLRRHDVVIAACSRTSAPRLANTALRLLLIPGDSTVEDSQPLPAIELFDEREIYPGSKITHFKRIHKKTGIPYSEMLFFDDELRNREVEELGVTFILVPNGVDNRAFKAGLAEWRKRQKQ